MSRNPFFLRVFRLWDKQAWSKKYSGFRESTDPAGFATSVRFSGAVLPLNYRRTAKVLWLGKQLAMGETRTPGIGGRSP